MHSSIYRFILDLHSTQSQISLPVSLGDTAREFKISFSDGGQPYIIDTGVLAKLEIKRPTGTYLEAFCPIEKNTTVNYKFSQNENTAVVAGVHDCSITLYDADGEKICSPRFSMVVSAKVINSDDINLTDDDKSAIDAIIAAEASRQIAETSRVNTEASRESAEESRANAEASREAAEADRANAEASRRSAETSRANSESSRKSTETSRVNAESSRKTAETGRVNAEASRESAEKGRSNAEASREAAETSRVNAEASRVAAEAARVATFNQIKDSVLNSGNLNPVYSSVSLKASAWNGEEDPYYQVVSIPGVTAHSKVDLLPSVEQLAIFHDKDIAFVSENENGVVTVFAIGDKPTLDYTIEVCITEVTL